MMSKYKKYSEQKIFKALMGGLFVSMTKSSGYYDRVTSIYKIRNYSLYELSEDSDFKWIKSKSFFWIMNCMVELELMIIEPENVKAFIQGMRKG